MILTAVLLALCAVCSTHGYNGRFDVEVYFVVDKSAQDLYENIGVRGRALTEEIDYIISEATGLFDAANIGVKLYKRGLEYLNTNLGRGTRDADQLLTSFGNWLDSNRKYAEFNYDAVVLLTGHDIHRGGNTAVAGLANKDAVCLQGRSVVEFRKSYFAALCLAHEIGHILGADHDNVTTGSVMGAEGDVRSPDRFAFSDATRQQLSTRLYDRESWKDCFKDRSPQSTYLTGLSLPQAVNEPNKICKRLLGEQSYYCGYGQANLGGSGTCQTIQCRVVGGVGCQYMSPYEGMTCGNRKACRGGQCVPDRHAPAATEGCPWGDVEKVATQTNGEQSCDTLVNSMRYSCGTLMSQCCKTCGGGGGGRPGNNGRGGGGGGSRPWTPRPWTPRPWTPRPWTPRPWTPRPPVTYRPITSAPRPRPPIGGGSGGCHDRTNIIVTLTVDNVAHSGSCTEVINSRNYGFACTDDRVTGACCGTCHRFNNGVGGGGGGASGSRPRPRPPTGGSGGCQDDPNISLSIVSPSGHVANGRCSEIITHETKLSCPGLEHVCCATCRRYASSDQNCKYGDQQNWCTQLPRHAICPSNSASCCETCRNYKREIAPFGVNPEDQIVPIIPVPLYKIDVDTI